MKLSCLFRSVLAACTLALGLSGARAANLDSKGTEFWLGFPEQLSVDANNLKLFITGDENTSGTVTIPGLGFSTNFNVVAGTVTTVSLPAAAQISGSDTISTKGVRVVAQKEVTVYGINRYPFTTDAYLGLPLDILGTEYIVLAYENVNIVNASQFAIVATEDATTVTITPKVTTGARPGGVPYNIVMNKGQTYLLRNTGSYNAVTPSDVTGTTILSTKPVAVFGGHQCANIPVGFVACDHIVEQLPPEDSWGRNFLTVPLGTRTGADTFRVIASDNGTTVTTNGVVVAVLNRGQFKEFRLTTRSVVSADKPVLLSQYSNSSSFDNVTSDPFMMLIPPFEQFLASYTVTTPASGFRTNLVNVVAPTSVVGALTMDGNPIPAGLFQAIGASGYSGAQVPVTLGGHTFSATLPFGVFSYGYDSFDSYGYPGGLALGQVARVDKLTLTPPTDSNDVGETACVTALVTDNLDVPLVGVRVDFEITGVHPTNSFAFTGADGKAVFCYTGVNVGDDTIVGSAVGLSATVTKEWTPAQAGSPPTVSCSSQPIASGAIYTVSATDDLDPAPKIYVTDSVTLMKFGPYPSGSTFVIRKNPTRTPFAKPGPAPYTASISVKGNALFSAKDSDGLESIPGACR